MPIDLEPGQRIPMSWQEYEELEGEQQGEYLDGAFVVSPLPSRRHQRACRRLINSIEDALPPGVEVSGSWGWKPGDDEFGPDVIVFDATEEDIRYTGIPHLCVEVLATDRGADLVRKFARYAAAGLRRYWVVDLEVPEITAFELVEGGFRESGRLVGDDSAPFDVGPVSVTLSPAHLLR